MKTMKTTTALFLILSAIYLTGCKSEAQKKVEAYQAEQVDKARQAELEESNKAKIDSFRHTFTYAFDHCKTLGCSFDEAKQYMLMPDGKEKNDLKMSYYNRWNTDRVNHKSVNGYQSDSEQVVYAIIRSKVDEYKATLK